MDVIIVLLEHRAWRVQIATMSRLERQSPGNRRRLRWKIGIKLPIGAVNPDALGAGSPLVLCFRGSTRQPPSLPLEILRVLKVIRGLKPGQRCGHYVFYGPQEG